MKTSKAFKTMSYDYARISEAIFEPRRGGIVDETTSSRSEETQIFYGTKNLYVFLRFFFVLYERLYKAQEISRSFEDSEKTQQLTIQEKNELSLQRYTTFKVILHGSLKLKETKYEDYLRSLFGKQAFLLFTIDRTLQSATKALQTLASDDLNAKILSLHMRDQAKCESTKSSRPEELEFA